MDINIDQNIIQQSRGIKKATTWYNVENELFSFKKQDSSQLHQSFMSSHQQDIENRDPFASFTNLSLIINSKEGSKEASKRMKRKVLKLNDINTKKLESTLDLIWP